MKISRKQLHELILEIVLLEGKKKRKHPRYRPPRHKGDNPCGKGFAPGAQSGVKTKIGPQSGRRVSNCEKINEADPAKGTGKKPPGSSRRLYTDENPKDTVSVKFRTAADIRKTLSKKSFKSKSHKRQSQIINLIHQRVRAAYKNAKDPATKKRLKTAYDYAKKRKEASKKKTARLNKKK